MPPKIYIEDYVDQRINELKSKVDAELSLLRRMNAFQNSAIGKLFNKVLGMKGCECNTSKCSYSLLCERESGMDDHTGALEPLLSKQ
jgi:hypothetical protein